MKNKDIHYYLNLPWTYTIETCFDEKQNPMYVLRVNELPGVCTDAPTVAEGMELIKEAMTAAFRLYMKQKEEIPEPINPNEYAGNISIAPLVNDIIWLQKKRSVNQNHLVKLLTIALIPYFQRI